MAPVATRTDKRKGLNATFSYHDAHGKRLMRFRCGRVQWGFTQIYDEAEGRLHRSMYPHQVTTQPFQVTALCKGFNERKVLTDWMREYAEFAVTPDPRTNIKMTVNVPSRKFLQVGVIKGGIEYGDHVGSMLWMVNFTFECAYDPLDTNAAVHASYFDYADADVLLKESLYFYPQSDANTLRGRQFGSDFTATIEPVYDAGAVTYDQTTVSTTDDGTSTSTDTGGG